MMDTAAVEDLKAHAKEFSYVYRHGLLHPKTHHRLVKDIKSLSRQAGINPLFVYTSMSKRCTAEEISWVKEFHKHRDKGIAGLGYLQAKNVEDRIMSIAGACMRNFLDARVMTLQEIISRCKEGDPPLQSVLLCPNFMMPGVPRWQSNIVVDLLLDRYYKGLQNVLYLGNLTVLANDYGSHVADHVTEHYTLVHS